MISIIIASVNDNVQLMQTILSIRETAGLVPQIVVIDDCSSTPVSAYVDGTDYEVDLVTNKHQCGCGPSRYIGALHARNDLVLFCDSHMRFVEGWLDAIQQAKPERNTLLCGHCLGLDSNNMDPNKPNGHYYGGTITLSGPDRNDKGGKWHVLEAIWNPREPEDGAEIAAPMGACYVANRRRFLELAPTRFDRIWGSDELCLALKYWRSGGEVRYLKNFQIGHRFLLKNEKQGFVTRPGYQVFNKLLAIETLVDEPQMQDALRARLKGMVPPGEWNAGYELLKQDWHLVAQELALNRTLFTRPLRWVMAKFGLTYQP